MKKLYGLCAALAVIALLFAGCPDPNNDDPGGTGDGTTVPVNSVSITKDGESTVINAPVSMYTDDADLQLRATVLPATATDKTVTWSSSDAAVATVDQTGKVKPVAAGSATIKAVTNGKKADGNSAEYSVTITVTKKGEVVKAELVLFNQADVADGTTTALPAFDDKGRITIKNTVTTGGWETALTAVKQNTFVYVDQPQSAPYTLSMRIKITSGVAAAGRTSSGVVVGAFSDPKTIASNETPLYFTGIRSATDGGRTIYSTRLNGSTVDNSSAATNLNPPQPVTNEYLITINRTDDTYNFKVIDDSLSPPVGLAPYGEAGYNRSGDSQIHPNLTGASSQYLGIMINGVEVEISSITVTQGTTTVYESPAATATVKPVITGITITNAEENTVSVGGLLTMKYSVQPEGADDRVTWSIDPAAGTVASIDAATGVLTGVGVGTVTVYATSVANSAVKSAGFGVTVSEAKEVLQNNRSWNFQTLPGGATEDTYFTTDLYYNQGMTLLGTGRSNGIKVTSAATIDDALSTAGLTGGFLQPNGACPTGYAKIVEVQGPFDITLKYHANTATANPARYSTIKIGESTVDGTGSSGSTDPKTFTYSYTGTDKVDVILQASANPGRIYDVIIEYKGN